MNSDSQVNDSQSELNNLNKLNPDDSEQQHSSSMSLKEPEQKPHPNLLSLGQKKQQPRPQQGMRDEGVVNIPKKQLTLVKQNKPRLIIDHMILKNFKSYAGVQKIGPFHKNFTSIVGPNGSGKSNLIQSMLFIFGFNASWMRLNKLQQLIHNSSSATNVGSAAVEVHFKKILDNQDGSVTQIPDSQFFIRRTVNSSSISKYYLNGVDSTQAQVKTKLKSQGIDLTNNRFLILQGQVQQISQMKQKSGDRDKPGFLQYLEDIIGSNEFIDRIEQAVKEYNEIEETKHEKGQRMRIVENELKGMSSQKQQAIKFVKKQRKIFQIQSILQQVLRSNSEFQLRKVKERISEFQRRKQQIIKQQKQKMAKQAQRVRQIKRIREQRQKLQRQIQRHNLKIGQLSAEDKNIKSQIAYNSEDQVKYEKKIQQINAQFSKIIEESDSIKKSLPHRQKVLALQKDQLDTLKTQVSKHDQPELRQKIKSFQSEIKKVTFTKSTLNDKGNTLQNQVSKLQQSKDGNQAKTQQYKHHLQLNLEIKAKIQIAIEVASKEFKQSQQQYSNQLLQLNKLRQESQSIENAIKEKHSQRFEQGQFNNMFNHIMKAGIPGVVGRLGDLGDIPKQYDQIITTACSRLDNIVTETYQAASRVLDLLKKNKLGRATCIILQKITQFKGYMNRPYHVPENAVRLFDVIKPVNEQARVAFYFALSNTLYCENIDQAMKLALGDQANRRRVIARKGRVLAIYEMNGIINSVLPRRGGFQKKAAQMKKNNQHEDRQLQQKHQSILRVLQSKSQTCRLLQRKIKDHQANFQTMRSQRVVSQGKIRDLTDQLKDIQKMLEKSKGKKQSIQNMQKQIKALQNEIQKIQGHIQRLQKGLHQVQSQQGKFETPQVSAMRQRYKTVRQQYTKLQKQVQKQQVLITTVEKRIKQNQSKKQTTQRQIQRLEKMIEKSKNDMQKIEQIGLQVLSSISTNTTQIQQRIRRQEQIKRFLEQDQDAVKQSRQKIQQARSNVDNARRQIRKAEEDYKFASNQLQRIRRLYSQMTSTYDFLTDIDQIQKMNIEHMGVENSSILDITLQNVSLDMDSRGTSTNKKSNRAAQNRILDMRRIQKFNPHEDLSQDQLDQYLLFQEKLRSTLSVQSQQLKRMQSKNLQIISEYKLKFIQYRGKLQQFQLVKQKQQRLKLTINELKQQRFQKFREGFSIINSKLKQVYQLLTNGGDAEMQLIDSLDPFSDGVNFSVRPPKKAWKQINKLSGGQKTLSSLSLIFALHYYKPTPLYFMDEIDAALDFKNVSIVGDYIKKRTKDAQFIIISLRNNMFDLADKLVGVYKTFDQTKVINLAAAKFLAKKQIISEQEKKEKEKQNEQIPIINEI